jgi:hypothetical protein
MSLNSLSDASSRLKAAKEYNRSKQEINQLKKDAGDAFQEQKKNIVTQIDQIKESVTGSTSNIKKFQKQARSQLQDLLGFAQENSGNGLSTSKFLKDKTVQAWRKVSPEIKKILVQESLNAVGCSQDQSYVPNTIYIKVSSTDLFDLFKETPDTDFGKVSYEKKPIVTPQNRPFSMNKAMLERIQNQNQSFSTSTGNQYKGSSGQRLFDMTYVQTNGAGVTGDFFKIDLSPRTTFIDGGSTPNTNKIKDFLQDYYSTINIIDTTNFAANLMNGLTGCLDIQAKVSDSKITSDEKISLIIQRILGLCFDNRSQIDVAGNAKLAELDGVDDGFFDLTEIDLRNIDEKLNDRRNGVVEFEGCEGIKLPVDYGAIYEGLLGIEGTTTEEQENESIGNLTQTLSNNPSWTLLVPTNINISIKLNLNFIVQLPKALIFAILTPKVLLPIMIMLKSLGKTIVDEFDDVVSFMKAFKKFFINLVSKIGALFVRELFELIKKDILILIKSIKNDILKAQTLKKYAIILSLIELIVIIAQLINDWRKCKSVIDEILALLSLSGLNIGGGVPLPLLAASSLRAGYSSTRAFINTIEEMQKLGLPTGPMPDGSANLGLAAMFSQIQGQDKENSQNGKTEVFVPALTVVAGSTTIPTSAKGVPL